MSMKTTKPHLFRRAVANLSKDSKLREPQWEVHQRIKEHFARTNTTALAVIPVGCGKTGVIATAPLGIAEGRVLVITPNVTIRDGVQEALDFTSPKCFWTKADVLASFNEGPYCAVLDGPDANLHDCNDSHFVVTNIHQLASRADRWLSQFPPDYFDMILVDEAHHSAAKSWRRVFSHFPHAKVVGLTATPFRSDNKALEGEIIYRYSFTRAMRRGYIKEIHSENAQPAELWFTDSAESKRYSLAEVIELSEETWFRRGIALSVECNRHIVAKSILRCQRLRESGTKHQIIAAACSIDHARQVRGLYEEHGWAAAEIHSKMDKDKKKAVLAGLRDGSLDCVVQVRMLGEGFDHPPLSVAAIFQPFRSLPPYIQFVGRIMRVLEQEAPGHPDNQGFVVSHVGLNNFERWAEFRELDLDDQELIRRWNSGEPARSGEGGTDGGGKPRRFDTGVQVAGDLLSHFLLDSFLDPEDDRVLDNLLEQEVAPNLRVSDLVDREELRARLRERNRGLQQTETTLPAPPPQRRRRVARKRLRERSQSVVTRVLADLDLKAPGREIGRVVKTARGQPNRNALSKLLSAAVNSFLGIGPKSRGEPSADELEAALAELDRLGDGVRDMVQEAMEGE